jgi:hypothetical protein
MFAQPRNKLAVMASVGLVMLALVSTSARANHDQDVVTPLVAGFALGALLNYGHSSHHFYRYQYQRHGHSRHGSGHRSGHGSGHGYGSHYTNSHYKKSHSSHGNYGHKPRHSSNRGSYNAPRRKH